MIALITEANMNESRHFTSRIAVVFAAVALVGASAFADSRHPKTTDSRGGGRATVQRGRTQAPEPAPAARGNDEQKRPVIAGRSNRSNGGVIERGAVREGGAVREREQERAFDLSPTRAERPGRVAQDRAGQSTRDEHQDRGVQDRAGQQGSRDDRNGQGEHDRAGQQGSRNDREGRGAFDRGGQGSRGENWNRGNGGGSHSYGNSHGKRQPYYAHGRVSKVHPYGNGYRVWVHGAPYPFFVPAAYYHHGHFGIGMPIRLGGYYNPRGYYDYYGDYESSAIAGQRLRGVVERVDPRRGEFVLNLSGPGGYVTVRMREHVRLWEGDYVVVYGDWSRNGRFVARAVDVIDDDYRW